MKITEEQIIDLIHSYHQNTISDEGIKCLTEWLDSDPNSKDEFANYLALLKEGGAMSQAGTINRDEAWNKISESLTKAPRVNKTRRLHQWLPYAAAAVIVFAVSYIMVFQVQDEYDFSKNYNFAEISSAGSTKAILTLDDGQVLSLDDKIASVITEEDGTLIHKDSSNGIVYHKAESVKPTLIYNRIDVPRGGEYSLTLADGTKVWLNSESSLKYPVQFVGSTRQVELTGEAYFEVSHNASKPFFVKAGDAEVKVLGTKFNISSYTDEEYIATTLVEGSVEVSNLGSKELLKPGYQAVVNRRGGEFQIQEVDTRLYTSWVNGVFEFKNNSLEEICHQLSRWYDVEFFFTEKQYRDLRFTGAAKREKPVGFALGMIEKMANVKFAIKNDKIVVGRPTD